jgi:hypothetical protein
VITETPAQILVIIRDNDRCTIYDEKNRILEPTNCSGFLSI